MFRFSHRPRLLMAYADSVFASSCVRIFRRLGWEVHMARVAGEVHTLVETLAPEIVVLDVDLTDESGWLISAKLALTQPDLPVVLLTAAHSKGAEALVRSVYAALDAVRCNTI